MKKLLFVSTLLTLGLSGQAMADGMLRTCTWVEQGAEVIEAVPEGCIQNQAKSSLAERLEAANPKACPRLMWTDEGKIFLSISSKAEQQIFVVARQCRL